MIGAGTQPPAVCHFLTFLSIYLLLVNFSLSHMDKYIQILGHGRYPRAICPFALLQCY